MTCYFFRFIEGLTQERSHSSAPNVYLNELSRAKNGVFSLYIINSLPAVRLENVTAQVTFSPDKNTVLGEVR